MTDEQWAASTYNGAAATESPASDEATWGSQPTHTYCGWPSTDEYNGSGQGPLPQQSESLMQPRYVPAFEIGDFEPQPETTDEAGPESWLEHLASNDGFLHPLYTLSNDGQRGWTGHYEAQVGWSRSTPGTPPSHAVQSTDYHLRPDLGERRSKSLPPAMERYVAEPEEHEQLACGHVTASEEQSILFHEDRARRRIARDLQAVGSSKEHGTRKTRRG